MNNGTFWGISDATVNVCENKYDKYTLIAEYYNTISAFCYMVVGTLTILLTRLKLLGKILCFIGVGTMLLHATLCHWAQICDEMSLLVLSFYTIRELNHDISRFIIYPILIIYFLFSKYFLIFFLIFTTMQLLIATYIKGSVNNNNKKWIFLYSVSFIIGTICWILDQICSRYGGVFLKHYQFHAWWHVFTAAASGFGIMALKDLTLC
jgi:hypothetical protein